jgi:hypothetical protein
MFHIDLSLCETRGVGGARLAVTVRVCYQLDRSYRRDFQNSGKKPSRLIGVRSCAMIYVYRLHQRACAVCICQHTSAYLSIRNSSFPKCDKTERSQSFALSEACFLCNSGTALLPFQDVTHPKVVAHSAVVI